jgi:cytochrome c biogenesis protein CcmG/thiol:disulfide interchange protein DsbE
MKLRFMLPVAGFVLLVGLLAIGLQRDPREVPSPLIDKPAPVFDLPRLDAPMSRFSPEHLRGQVWLLNVWASWCVSCREEHPILLKLSHSGTVPVIGLDYKDQKNDAQQFLQRLGNPYQVIAFDADGRVGIDYGVYGVPETYVIDAQGVIRHKHIGPLTTTALEKTVLPLIDRLRARATPATPLGAPSGSAR